MKTNIDTLMQERNIDALLIVGPGQHNPAMVYMTGVAHLTDAYLIKKRGQPPVLLYRPAERDEAALSGLETRSIEAYGLSEILEQTHGDMLRTSVTLLERFFADLEIISGRVALYGLREAGDSYAVFTALQQALPNVTFVGEMGDSLLMAAMMTKDQTEIERIRRVGQATTEVVANVADYLVSRPVRDEVLYKSGDEPLTIGHVKNQIDLWLAERGIENPKGAIFAIGRDAGVPHSSGTPGDLLCLGQTIVFDIFPCERNGGYFHDFTRTWCLGYAPDQALALYEDVLSVYRQVVGELRVGAPFKDYQELTCELFRQRGHTTVMDDPLSQQGYVHGLGHGVGLHVHEQPFSRTHGSDRLEPGVVFTIEPGLYYPERGMGVRLEDTYWIPMDGGGPRLLVEYPLDFVLPMG